MDNGNMIKNIIDWLNIVHIQIRFNRLDKYLYFYHPDSKVLISPFSIYHQIHFKTENSIKKAWFDEVIKRGYFLYGLVDYYNIQPSDAYQKYHDYKELFILNINQKSMDVISNINGFYDNAQIDNSSFFNLSDNEKENYLDCYLIDAASYKKKDYVSDIKNELKNYLTIECKNENNEYISGIALYQAISLDSQLLNNIKNPNILLALFENKYCIYKSIEYLAQSKIAEENFCNDYKSILTSMNDLLNGKQDKVSDTFDKIVYTERTLLNRLIERIE